MNCLNWQTDDLTPEVAAGDRSIQQSKMLQFLGSVMPGFTVAPFFFLLAANVRNLAFLGSF